MRKPLVDKRRLQRIIDDNCDQFRSAGVDPIPYTLRSSNELKSSTDVILLRENGRIIVLFDQNWQPDRLMTHRRRIAAYLYWFSQTTDRIRRITVDLSDGNSPTGARYRFSTFSALETPVPDAFFFRDRGYAATDAFAANDAPAWDDRSDDIVWRGGINGMGAFSVDPAAANNVGVMQRLRMALKCKDTDVDFKFIYNEIQPQCKVLRSAGLTGNRVPTNDWGSKKYAIDIDGYTNAWCNFMQRLKLGCCVLKVDSQFGYYQWYYEKLVPGEHFVPIRADLSDLQEKLDWVRTNPKEARRIAQQGQAFAKAMTFESERDRAIEIIEEREARG